MKEQNAVILAEKVKLTELSHKFAIHLMKHSFFNSAVQRGDVLSTGLRYKMLQALKLIPRATRLVAYHIEEQAPIGFLYLEENTEQLYTIEYVFVDPKYRRQGLATRLLNYAMLLAKEKGARKINLNVTAKSTKVIDLYEKLGFRKIGFTFLAQSFLSDSPTPRLIKRVFLGQGCLTKLALRRKNRLFEMKTNSRKNRSLLFRIYQQCMDRRWIDFFEINAINLTRGSRHVWQPPFFRDVLINNSFNSLLLIFSLPLSSRAMVELYSTSNTIIPHLLEDLLKYLSNRGVSFVQIYFFNPINKLTSKWFEKKVMMTFEFVTMGKAL
jgi:ribosomal protein S18 acetylase RimI-like enzyme